MNRPLTDCFVFCVFRRLSEGDVEGCLECAKTGLMLDRYNTELQSLRDMAVTMLSDEIEALLDQGDADQALEHAARRRDASPDIVAFSTLHVRAEGMATKLHAADARVRDVGHSLVEYERAATTLVHKAILKMEEAKEDAAVAEQGRLAAESWQEVAEREEEKCDRMQGMWQTRAIRKMRRGEIITCFEAWIKYNVSERVHHKATDRMRMKHARRMKFIVWQGWRKFAKNDDFGI